MREYLKDGWAILDCYGAWILFIAGIALILEVIPWMLIHIPSPQLPPAPLWFSPGSPRASGGGPGGARGNYA